MPQLELKLPSGARGIIRGLKGEEINIFANKQQSRRGKTAIQILTNVWIETTDGGPLYPDGKIDWSKAPACDRFVALFKARVATYGKEYAFKYQCTSHDCRKRFEWVIDLDEDMVIKDLPEKSVQNFLEKNRFTTSVVDPEGNDLKVVFQLLTPKIENKIDQVQGLAPKEKATASLAQRIVEIEGLEAGKGAIKTFLNDLDAGSMLDLVRDMDDVDGGIETAIEIECDHCGCIMAVELPLLEEFWTPSRRKLSTKS